MKTTINQPQIIHGITIYPYGDSLWLFNIAMENPL